MDQDIQKKRYFLQENSLKGSGSNHIHRIQPLHLVPARSRLDFTQQKKTWDSRKARRPGR